MTRQRWIPWGLAALAVLLVVVATQRPKGSSDSVALDSTPAAAVQEQLPDADASTDVADDATVATDPAERPSDNVDPATAASPDEDGDAAGAEPAGDTTDSSASTDSPTATAEPTPSATAVVATPPPPTPTPTPAPTGIEGYRLRVPSLGVNASMIDLGVDDNGVMEVPLQAQEVAWYRFTAVPGEPGNILLGGHITWRGATAVFRYLEEMSTGDEIYIDTPSGETIRYVVRETWWADPYAATDVRKVIGTRSGQQTITLFTCGGIWDSDAREYSHRRVVTAVRI